MTEIETARELNEALNIRSAWQWCKRQPHNRTNPFYGALTLFLTVNTTVPNANATQRQCKSLARALREPQIFNSLICLQCVVQFFFLFLVYYIAASASQLKLLVAIDVSRLCDCLCVYPQNRVSRVSRHAVQWKSCASELKRSSHSVQYSIAH